MKATEVKVGDVLALQTSTYARMTRVTVLATGYTRAKQDADFFAPDTGETVPLRAVAKGDPRALYAGGLVTVARNDNGVVILTENRYLVGYYDLMVARKQAEHEAKQDAQAERKRQAIALINEAEALVGPLEPDFVIPYTFHQFKHGNATHLAKDIERVILAAKRALAKAEETP